MERPPDLVRPEEPLRVRPLPNRRIAAAPGGILDQMAPPISQVQAALPSEIELLEEIYTGGQRTVYRAKVAGVLCVLKLMRADARNRAEREVAIGHRFDHPNLPRVLHNDLRDVEVAGEPFVYFAETLIDGQSVADIPVPMEPCAALALTRDLVEAVSYLWTRFRVVHRDIKPLNIIHATDGRYVLLDVGIGRHIERSSITAGLFGPGTRGYAAPEMLIPGKGRDVDARTDLFLVGVVLYQALTGRLPFDPNDMDYAALVISGDFEPIPGLPNSVEELLRRLLAPHPHQRFNARAASAAIARASQEMGCS